jgi:hypothetical protein
MTKKSNARKLRMAGQTPEPPTRFREMTIAIPVEMHDRIVNGMERAVHGNLIPVGLTRHEFMLVIMANGIAHLEADLLRRERKDALILTPAELQAQQKALRGQV